MAGGQNLGKKGERKGWGKGRNINILNIFNLREIRNFILEEAKKFLKSWKIKFQKILIDLLEIRKRWWV